MRGASVSPVLGVDLNTAVGGVVAADFAPSDLSYWGYALAEPSGPDPVAKQPVATPSRPTAGRAFAVSLPVTRSDTGRPISSGAVGCRVLVAGAAVRATGASSQARLDRSSCRARRKGASCAGRSASAWAARSSLETSHSPWASCASRASFTTGTHLLGWGKTPAGGPAHVTWRQQVAARTGLRRDRRSGSPVRGPHELPGLVASARSLGFASVDGPPQGRRVSRPPLSPRSPNPYGYSVTNSG